MSICSLILLDASQEVLYLLIFANQSIESRKSMKCCAEANSVIQM